MEHGVEYGMEYGTLKNSGLIKARAYDRFGINCILLLAS